MRKFDNDEIQKRQKIVGPCHSIYSLFNEKRKLLSEDWPKVFDSGKVEHVKALFGKTSNIVDSQIAALNALQQTIITQENELKLAEQKVDRHIRAAKLVENHFTFEKFILELLHKEEPDLERVNGFLRLLREDLEKQRSQLASVKSQGEGKQAYIEPVIKKLAAEEMKILRGIQPFWHDWELLVPRIEQFISDKGEVSQDELAMVEEDVKKLVGTYHKQFANNERAPQIGTELAINLYIQLPVEIGRIGRKIPISIINVDVTAFNNLDGTHELGDTLIEVCYDNLNKKFARRFKLSDGKELDSKGVVTILGRTRFKIVGVPKLELEQALKEIPDMVMAEIVRQQGHRFLHDDTKKERFLTLNTKMLAGYTELNIAHDRDEFQQLLFALDLTDDEYIRGKMAELEADSDIDLRAEKETMRNRLRDIEKGVAKKICDTIKMSAAKAEYLEKEYYDSVVDNRADEYKRRLDAEGIPEADESAVNEQRRHAINNDINSEIPLVLVYAEKIDKVWIGRNYIPEDEFEGRMIKRIAHQIGLDNFLTENLFWTCRILARITAEKKLELEGKSLSYRGQNEPSEGISYERLHDILSADFRFIKENMSSHDVKESEEILKGLADGFKLHGENTYVMTDTSALTKLLQLFIPLLKRHFYQQVLQKRHIAKSYDLRFTKALTEEAYDELLPKMMMVEGPQIMTFIELDGFNAFNKTYKPDSQDTFYHAVLKLIFDKFQETFNKGVDERHHRSLRMTKQGDEIWISYPLHTGSEKDPEKEKKEVRKRHQAFLENVRLALVKRSEGEALVIDNLHTVDWIPYLIENRTVMKQHLVNAFENKRNVRLHNNSKFRPDKKLQEGEKPRELTPLEAEGEMNTLFPHKLIGGQKQKLEQDEEDFSKWTSFDDCRQLTGTGLFGPDKLTYAYLLFHETVKIEKEGSSERAPTGRVIRLGTTIGYLGFNRPVIRRTSHEMQITRKILNGHIEDVRKVKGRGGIHDLEKTKIV